MTSKSRFLLHLAGAVFLTTATLAAPARDRAVDTYGASFGADSIEGSAAPGFTATYTLTLTNIGTVPDTYSIMVLPGPAGWSAWPSVTSVSLDAQASAMFDVEVEVPVYCAYGALEATTVSAMSEGSPPLYATIALITTAVDSVFSNGFENPG